jgi:cysteine desulfurase
MTSAYLDFAATTPVDERVADIVMRYMRDEFGNAGSRTHEFGARAAKAVERAREQVAALTGVESSGVIFTSGATEANNLAILGLAENAERTGNRHIVTTAIEHKAVLEPIKVLQRRGFEVDLVDPGANGVVSPTAVLERVRPTTFLVSVMHVNNETGARQPIKEIADALAAYQLPMLHTDAAQGYGKDADGLDHDRIDLISISGHKLFAPKGIGALLLRRRNRRRPPLSPLMHGGGQERGLRPGTLAVPLIAGLGLAAELSDRERPKRTEIQLSFRRELLQALQPLGAVVNGDLDECVPHIVNVSIPDIDSEAAIVALKGTAAVSNGSACTSSSYEPSHVLTAMGLSDREAQCAIRLSWSHHTEADLAPRIARTLRSLL